MTDLLSAEFDSALIFRTILETVFHTTNLVLIIDPQTHTFNI